MCRADNEAEHDNQTVQGPNLTVSKVQRDKLIQYYHRRRDALDFCGATFHHAIEDETQEIMDLINKGRRSADDPEIQQALGTLSGPIASTLRNCLFIAVCCFLDDLLRRAGNLILNDYDAMFRKNKQEHRDNFLKTHLRILETRVGMKFQPLHNQIAQLDYAVSVRNALVHAWGKVETSTNPDRLREVLGALTWAVESGDGYIALSDQAYPDTMHATMDLVEYVFEQLRPSE